MLNGSNPSANLPLRHRLFGERGSAVPLHTVARDRLVLGGLGLLVVFELLYIFLAHTPTNIADESEYQQIGHHFGSWWASGDARRTPGYPLFLAINYKLHLGNVGAQLEQAVAVAATALGVSLLIGMAAGLTSARVAAWTQAIYLPFLSYASAIMSDVLAVCASTLGVLCVVLAVRDEHVNYWYVAGAAVLFVAATITRPVNLLFLLAVLAVLILLAGRWRDALGIVVVFVLAFALAFGPWVSRNYARDSHPYLLGSTGHTQLGWGLHLPWDKRVGEFAHWDRSVTFYANKRPDGFTPTDAAYLNVGKTLRDDLTHHFGEFTVSRAVAQGQLWVWPITARTQFNAREHLPYVLIMVEHLALLLLGVIGLLSIRKHFVGRLTGMLVLITAVEFLFYYPGPRYAFAVTPFVVGAAGVSIAALLRRWREPGTAAPGFHQPFSRATSHEA